MPLDHPSSNGSYLYGVDGKRDHRVLLQIGRAFHEQGARRSVRLEEFVGLREVVDLETVQRAVLVRARNGEQGMSSRHVLRHGG